MRTVVAFAVAMILAGSMAWAQSTAQIQGIVRDSSGSSVPGAEVKATQTETGAVRTAPTGADGTYVLASLPVGPYRIEVGGFAGHRVWQRPAPAAADQGLTDLRHARSAAGRH